MKLYVIQHGEAMTSEQDPERPLSDKGREDIKLLAQFLANQHLMVGRVVHSGKTRARQTAEILAEAIAENAQLETSSQLSPNDPVGPMVEHFATSQEDILVVGHLPFVSRLVSHLITANEANTIVAFQPGTMICLEHDDADRWAINWMIRPGLLA